MPDTVVNTTDTAAATVDTNAGTGTQADNATATTIDTAAPISLETLPEKELLAHLNKVTGGNYKSLKDLEPKPAAPSKEEADEAEKKEKTEALTWAISNPQHSKVTKELYEKSLIDLSKTDREIAYALFAAEAKEENKNISNEEIDEMFKDAFFEGEDEKGTFKNKKGLAEIKKTADQFRNQYEPVSKMTEEYRKFKTTGEKLKNYKKVVRENIEALPTELSYKIPYTSPDGKVEEMEFKIPVDASIVSKIKSEWEKEDIFFGIGADNKEIKPEFFKEQFNDILASRHRDKAIVQVATEYGKKVEEKVLAALKGYPAPAPRIPTQPNTRPVNQSDEAAKAKRDEWVAKVEANSFSQNNKPQ